jgi:tRNA (guanine9-N1)-methyltransferase
MKFTFKSQHLVNTKAKLYFIMSDTEERPSKIRKVGDSNNGKEIFSRDQELLASTQANPSNNPTTNDDEDHDAATQLQSEARGGMSKSQLKKLRKQEQWEAGKEFRKAKRREKHKEKQSRKAEERAELQAKIAAGEIEVKPISLDEDKKKRPSRPIQTPVSLILDCDFDELMTDKELISLGAQLTRCYSDNRCTPYRSHLAISSWGGKLQSRFETVLTNNHLGWKGVRFFGDDFEAAAKELDRVMVEKEGGKLVGAFSQQATASEVTEEAMELLPSISSPGEAGKSGSVATTVPTKKAELTNMDDQKHIPTGTSPSIVYLTSDSPHTLESLSPYTSYIIGGIVDKNRHKGICYKRACERGIPTAKLPIGEYMTMQSRSVLAINHVVEIMLKWLETGDWGEAFLSVIPKRKEAKLKSQKIDGLKDGKKDDGEEPDAEGSDDDDEDGTS